MQTIRPRGKGRVGKTLGLREAYKEFDKSQTPGSLFYVDYKTYRAVCEEFNRRIVQKILQESGEFKLPHRLGLIRIQKRKMHFDTNSMKIDWKATRELGRRVYHMNDHRDNHRYRWYWKKKGVVVQNRTIYSFTASRANKRELARILKTSNKIDYFE